MRTSVRFWYRDQWHQPASIAPTDLVLPYVREQCRQVGSKEGCNEGDCGACTALIARLDDGRLHYAPINTCITPLVALDGAWLITVDDLVDSEGALHPIQQAVMEENASQCGFCTPGFVMALLAGQLDPEPTDPLTCLAGNLCRCTGYGGLIEVARHIDQLPTSAEFEAKAARAHAAITGLTHDEGSFIAAAGRIDAPITLDTLLALRAEYPNALLVGGATDVGLWITKRLDTPEHLILTRFCDDLRALSSTDTHLHIGAAADYRSLRALLLGEYPELTTWLDQLGSAQVRAQGTLGGNVANGSPIGDAPPVLMALGATVTLQSTRGTRTLPVESFFLDYRRTALAADEVIVQFLIPRRSPAMRIQVDKISRRHDQDISTALVACVQRGAVIRIGLGGLAATPRLAEHVMRSRAIEDLQKDITPLSDLRASAQYRYQVTEGLIREFLSHSS